MVKESHRERLLVQAVPEEELHPGLAVCYKRAVVAYFPVPAEGEGKGGELHVLHLAKGQLFGLVLLVLFAVEGKAPTQPLYTSLADLLLNVRAVQKHRGALDSEVGSLQKDVQRTNSTSPKGIVLPSTVRRALGTLR